jgi:hypothetical protein
VRRKPINITPPTIKKPYNPRHQANIRLQPGGQGKPAIPPACFEQAFPNHFPNENKQRKPG